MRTNHDPHSCATHQQTACKLEIWIIPNIIDVKHMNFLYTVLRRDLEFAPDFLAIDGGEGGSGAAPLTQMDHMALPITEALPWTRCCRQTSGAGSG